MNCTTDFGIFTKVLKVLKDGMEITFTADNVAPGDNFLLFGYYKSCTCTFRNHGLWYVYFDNDEPMLLENCPESFYRSIIKNAK